jgi:hypothetical protein
MKNPPFGCTFLLTKELPVLISRTLGWQQSGAIPRGLVEVLRFLYARKLRKKWRCVLETLVLDLEFERTSGVEVLWASTGWDPQGFWAMAPRA